ncbi:TetR/AcrR family transcriptional regulator [Streptomyces uncialis]|uniref:TetR/AcrR family transcriptional regulator n=1 Tax=Streptomyces uncialis TaxID=1048205 RepID=UPI0037951772
MDTATTARSAMPRPRADALRNRERIVVAAREMFVAHGPEVPFDEIARRAGVGNATVYRHFPDRRALVRGVVCHVFENVSRLAETALDGDTDPYDALCDFVHAAADERTSALCPMLADDFDSDHPSLVEVRVRIERLLAEVLDRAVNAGQLRTDVSANDLLLAVSQLTRPLPGRSGTGTGRFAHRHLQVFLDGLRAPARSVLPGDPPSLEDLRQQSCARHSPATGRPARGATGAAVTACVVTGGSPTSTTGEE